MLSSTNDFFRTHKQQFNEEYAAKRIKTTVLEGGTEYPVFNAICKCTAQTCLICFYVLCLYVFLLYFVYDFIINIKKIYIIVITLFSCITITCKNVAKMLY